MRIKRLLSGLKVKLFGTTNTVLEISIAGHTVKCLKGTINRKVDQDDAWLFHLTGQVSSIYDIGANTGYITLLALLPGEREVLMVDPQPLGLVKSYKESDVK